jgi:hypothetical protein
MALQTANQFQLAPNIASNLGGGVKTGQNIAGQFQLGKQRDQQIQQTEEDATVKRFLNSALELSTVPDDQKLSALKQNKAAILARGGETSDTDAGIALAEAGDFETLNNEIQGIITNGERRGLIKPEELGLEATAGQRERSDLINDLTPALNDQGQIDPTKLTATSQAAAIELGLISGEGRSTFKERAINDEATGESLVNLESDIAGGKETAKLKAQEKLLPKVRAAIKLAESEAVGRGETLSTLNKAKAALPGLKEVTNRLKTLSEVATYSLGGRGWDALVRESGFGSTKGATARSTMTAIVNNQVLPLLRDTFGSAFTEKEGESLRATILDVNLPPEQRAATIDAFIEQKVRNIETMERELSDYPGVSEADIYETMKTNNMTMEEVLEKLKENTNGR